MTTERFDQVIARADRVMAQLDRRDGAVREAATRERQRLNSDLKRRAGRVAVALLVISMLTIVFGAVIAPIGMFGFLAAVGLGAGAAVLLALTPTKPSSAQAPSADLPNGEMVQSFDSYLYRSRSALPAPAQAHLDRISAALPALRQTLERVDPLDPSAQDARRLMSKHLPGLIDRYLHVPSAYRGEADGEGITVDERLVEGLAAGHAALADISERLARDDIRAVETHGRFLKARYAEQDLPESTGGS